jgi:MerR family redox-sensitive transcriptional activator SoxR
VDHEVLTIGAVSERTGVAPSALRFYEAEGLIHAHRSESGQRRYHREVLRRIAFVRVAQQMGLSLEEIRDALASLPDERTPTQRDWERLATSWRPRLDAQIALLERLRDARGPGPRYVLDPGG